MATQAGFATPSQVMEAAAAVLIEKDGRSLLQRLETTGVLTQERRALLEAMADAALASSGSRDDATYAETFASSSSADEPLPVAIEQPFVAPEREGQYSLIREIGRGGQSAVIRALDRSLGREVAIKELLPRDRSGPTGSSSATEARFLREVRLTAQLEHPGIVAVHELAQRADGTLFCTQKLIRGETLKIRLARCRSLEERLALLPHLIDACHAVAYAHSRGVIHRDLKPSNIMVGEFGETVVVDWGLAKRFGEPEPPGTNTPAPDPAVDSGLTVAGVALGTPSYMSPEQARGALEEIDPRSDIFSLGTILYELLGGRLPFEGTSNGQIIENVLVAPLVPLRSICPEMPADLAAIVERALQRVPANRYQSADALATDLLDYRAGNRVQAYEYRSWELLGKFARRHRGLALATAATLLVLAAFGVNTWRQLRHSRLDLARSLLERARDAEKESDWARAAGYYAASRIQHDSREARWGYALARERMPHRLFARRGPDDSVLDVGFLRNGVALTVAAEPPFVVGRELESGRELWRVELPGSLAEAHVSRASQVELILGDRRVVLDAANGRLLETFVRGEELPCGSGSSPPRVLFRAEGLVSTVGPEPFLISPKLEPRWPCVISDDGRQVAFLEATGVVHLWDLVKRKELGTRAAPDTSRLLFTRHGLAILRARGIQVFGGDEGDFSVAIPGRGGNGLMAVGGRGNAVSPDGNLLVISRLTSNQADLVDLRLRTVVASFSFPPGIPSFTFSPSGDRLLVAGLLHRSVLAAWDLRSPDPPRSVKGSPMMAMQSDRYGQRFEVLHYSLYSSKYEVWEDARLLHSGALGARANATLSADGRRIAVTDLGGVEFRDAVTGQTLWHIDCDRCFRVRLSRDGGRLLTWSPEGGVDLWDLEKRASVWSERSPVAASNQIDLSGDGRLVLRSRGAKLLVSSVDGAVDSALQLDDAIQGAKFSYDGARIGVITRGSIGVWRTQDLQRIWRIPSPSPVEQEVYWSADDSALMILQDSLGTLLLDSATGERFATLSVTKPGAFSTQEVVLPSLRQRISRGDGSWQLWPIPAPDDGPAKASLARVLSEAGLEMHGVELADTVPPRPVAPQ
ncbi:MAG TPA: WD40 repeat domain-containing serine/threonine protein kinase [Myxococcaceae bacterium]|nr:WD40 repeat domain-containing serine/threonine protein kinase [Myxococcaceae bacterium]